MLLFRLQPAVHPAPVDRAALAERLAAELQGYDWDDDGDVSWARGAHTGVEDWHLDMLSSGHRTNLKRAKALDCLIVLLLHPSVE